MRVVVPRGYAPGTFAPPAVETMIYRPLASPIINREAMERTTSRRARGRSRWLVESGPIADLLLFFDVPEIPAVGFEPTWGFPPGGF